MLSGLSFAQTKGGDIYGSVTLADGSKLPGVVIELTSNAAGKMTTTSSGQGNFRFLALPPGTYDLKFALAGFKTVVRRDINVSSGGSVTISVYMETSSLLDGLL